MPGKSRPAVNKVSRTADASIVSRKAALSLLLAVFKDGKSLSSLNHLTENIDARDAAFAKMLSFGVLRFFHQLQALLEPLMQKPLKSKDLDIKLIIVMALYQIMHTRVPDYAVVDAAVKQVRKSRKQWAANMVNGVLRNFIRQQKDLIDGLTTEEAKYSHPEWIINCLKNDWPDKWPELLQANNAQAPMTLRINRQKISTGDYLKKLEEDYELSAETVSYSPSALILNEARDVTQLPGFADGWVSVQDAGAQLAAQFLHPEAGENILDACAAPGGKTAHMFELQPRINITALDISESRLCRVKENCTRLGFKPKLVVADASDVDGWWNGEAFDKILLDVPCSATGVIRRHPDIKHLRREEDIAALVQVQRDILVKNWGLLKPGGRLLYATCSVFKAENQRQIEWFLQNTLDAQLVDLSADLQGDLQQCYSSKTSIGIQLFPDNKTHDGFYYALVEKKAVSANLN